jgi:hypothetical protein
VSDAWVGVVDETRICKCPTVYHIERSLLFFDVIQACELMTDQRNMLFNLNIIQCSNEKKSRALMAVISLNIFHAHFLGWKFNTKKNSVEEN